MRLGFHKKAGHEEADARNERLNALHGILNNVSLDLYSPFLSKFALDLGASATQTALLSSGPALAALVAMIPGGRYVDCCGDKKGATLRFMLANRALIILFVLVPFLPIPWKATALIVIVTLMNLPGAIANVAWQGFIADVIPADRRADAFARRNRVMNIAGTLVTLAAGVLMDSVPFPLGNQAMFLMAFIIGLLEVAVFMRISPPKPVTESGAPFINGAASAPEKRRGASIKKIGVFMHNRDNREFIRFTVVLVVFYFGWQTPWRLFDIYLVKELHANYFWISLLALLSTGGNVAGYGFWIKQIGRIGNRGVLLFSSIPIVFVPFIYASFHSIYAIAALNVLIGIALSGLVLSMFNALLEVVPREGRTSYIAYYNTAITLTSVVAPLWGVGLYELIGFTPAFIVCGIQRVFGVAALFLLWKGSFRSR